MPSLNEAMSCCPVCLRQDIEAKSIQSQIPYATGGIMMENRSGKDSGVYFSCPSCGEFVVTNCDCVNLKSDRLRTWKVTHLSALLREQTARRLPPFWLRTGIMEPYGPLDWQSPLAHIDLEELLQRWPRTVVERIDRTLCNFASLSRFGGDRITIRSADDNPLAFAENIGEAIFHKRALIDSQYLEEFFEPGNSNCDVRVTPKGWARFNELTRGRSDRHNPVFVAMWFGGKNQRGKMDELFAKGIQPAIKEAGYDVTRSDLAEFNDWIMDKILGDIRLAPFVVADFTRHNNGVYLEAGFARGLGIPVINTCRADRLRRAHFDTAQLNHVVWNSPEQLREKLYHRILGSIGEGPHTSQRKP